MKMSLEIKKNWAQGPVLPVVHKVHVINSRNLDVP